MTPHEVDQSMADMDTHVSLHHPHAGKSPVVPATRERHPRTLTGFRAAARLWLPFRGCVLTDDATPSIRGSALDIIVKGDSPDS